KLWDLETGREIWVFKGHSRQVESVAISPDGMSALSGSSDGRMKVWDLSAGRESKTFEGHSGWVGAGAFSPDGKKAYSGSLDGTIRLWDLRRGEELVAIIASLAGQQLAITPKGFFAASAQGADMLVVVRGLESYSIMQFYEHLHRPDLVAELLRGDPEGKYRSAANILNLESIIESGPTPKLERLLDREKRDGS